MTGGAERAHMGAHPRSEVPDSREGERVKAYESVCEVWVKPLFRKSRPKVEYLAWSADSDLDFLAMVRDHYSGKRFKLLRWHSLEKDVVS